MQFSEVFENCVLENTDEKETLEKFKRYIKGLQPSYTTILLSNFISEIPEFLPSKTVTFPLTSQQRAVEHATPGIYVPNVNYTKIPGALAVMASHRHAMELTHARNYPTNALKQTHRMTVDVLAYRISEETTSLIGLVKTDPNGGGEAYRCRNGDIEKEEEQELYKMFKAWGFITEDAEGKSVTFLLDEKKYVYKYLERGAIVLLGDEITAQEILKQVNICYNEHLKRGEDLYNLIIKQFMNLAGSNVDDLNRRAALACLVIHILHSGKENSELCNKAIERNQREWAGKIKDVKLTTGVSEDSVDSVISSVTKVVTSTQSLTPNLLTPNLAVKIIQDATIVASKTLEQSLTDGKSQQDSIIDAKQIGKDQANKDIKALSACSGVFSSSSGGGDDRFDATSLNGRKISDQKHLITEFCKGKLPGKDLNVYFIGFFNEGTNLKTLMAISKIINGKTAVRIIRINLAFKYFIDNKTAFKALYFASDRSQQIEGADFGAMNPTIKTVLKDKDVLDCLITVVYGYHTLDGPLFPPDSPAAADSVPHMNN